MSEQKVPAGFYKGRAIEGSEQYGTTTNGNDQILIDVEVPALERNFTVFLVFSDAAAQYAIDKLRACGWEGDDVSNLAGIGKNEVDIAIKYESYQGKERMKVDIYAGGGRFTLENQMDDKQKRSFAARMKSMMKGGASNGAATPKPPPTARRSAAPVSDVGGSAPDDEIPF